MTAAAPLLYCVFMSRSFPYVCLTLLCNIQSFHFVNKAFEKNLHIMESATGRYLRRRFWYTIWEESYLVQSHLIGILHKLQAFSQQRQLPAVSCRHGTAGPTIHHIPFIDSVLREMIPDLMQSRHTSVTERFFSGNSTSIKYLPGRPMTLPTPKLLCAWDCPQRVFLQRTPLRAPTSATCSSAFARSSAAALAASIFAR